MTTTPTTTIFASLETATLRTLIADCLAERKRQRGGHDEDALTAEDCTWIVSQLPRMPTREEWSDAGRPDMGGRHVLTTDWRDITVGHVATVWSGTPDLCAYVSVPVTVEGETATVGCRVGIPEADHGSAIAAGSYGAYGSNTADWADQSDWLSVGEHLRDTVLEALHQASDRLLREALAMGLPAEEE